MSVKIAFETGLPAVKPSKVEVFTGTYEFNYGKKPSGYGSWAFIDEEHENLGNYYDYAFWSTGTYSEAKKAAKAYYAALGITLISVLT